MSGVNVVNGVATLDLISAGEFVGSTCLEGMFPPTGLTYRQFAFAPKKGTNGLLVFKSSTLSDHYNFQPYFWKDGKLFVEYEHQYDPVHPFIQSGGFGGDDFGFMVQYRPNRIFVTKMPVRLTDGVEYLLVDVMTFFRFINGKINRRQLARAVVLSHKREGERVTQQQMLEAAAADYRNLHEEYHRVLGTSREFAAKARGYGDLLRDICDIVRNPHETWKGGIRSCLLRAILGDGLTKKITDQMTNRTI